MPATARAIPIHAKPTGDDDPRQQPKTLYLDFAQLESVVSGSQALRIYHRTAQQPTAKPGRVTTVDDEVTALRSNVQDAARAVLTWLAGVTQHQDNADLDRVLDKCLRPGPDTSAMNYSALAKEINRSLGLDLSAKRVQTAIRHLRNAASPKTRPEDQSRQTTPLAQHLDALYARLRINHDQLVREQQGGGARSLHRAVAHDVLCVLRSTAGRLIECGFGEGIPEHADLDATRQRYLTFVRHAVKHGLGADGTSTLRDDLNSLLTALHDHDATAEADMQLVVSGACVVADLTGPDSLPGVMARLNVLMVGRPMLDSRFFVNQMFELAEAAERLIDDHATRAYLSWVRQQPEDRQTPSPNRVRSYCLNNAATHILQRLHTGELRGGQWFADAQRCFDTMMRHDRGFRLLKTTEAIILCVLAGLSKNDEPALEFFRKLGQAKSLDLLRDLARYDNSPALNRLVRRHADQAHPGIGSQLLVLPA